MQPRQSMTFQLQAMNRAYRLISDAELAAMGLKTGTAPCCN
jgi:hypothetical protein